MLFNLLTEIKTDRDKMFLVEEPVMRDIKIKKDSLKIVFARATRGMSSISFPMKTLNWDENPKN